MKAIRVRAFGGPEGLNLETVPTPAAGHGEVLVSVRAVGVNPVETYIRSGNYAALPTLPYTPGTDAAGVIAEVGAGVTGIGVGDRVYTTGSITGTYAGSTVCNAHQVWSLPTESTFAEGAALGVPYSTAFKALFIRGHAQPGECVLVHGATGGVGLACVQLAAAAGLRVFGTGGSIEGLAVARTQGAAHVFDHHSPAYADEIMAATDGKGVDLIIEMLANVNLANDLKLLARQGRIVVVGSRGKIEIDPRALMRTEGQIRAVLSMTAEERSMAQAAIIAGLKAKTLRPVIAREFELGEAAAAHSCVLGKKPPGKIVLIPSSDAHR